MIDLAIIFQILFGLIRTGANIFLIPVNAIVSTAFPDFSNIVATFNNFISTYISPLLVYFFSFLPTGTRSVVILYLELILILYSASLAVHAVIKVIEIIKAIKIW